MNIRVHHPAGEGALAHVWPFEDAERTGGVQMRAMAINRGLCRYDTATRNSTEIVALRWRPGTIL